MRKFINLISEYQKISAPPWSELPERPAAAHKLGQVQSKIGEVTLWGIYFKASDGKNKMSIWGELKQKQIDVAYMLLLELGDHTVLQHAFVLPEYTRNAILSEMINFTIRVTNIPLINDTQMSPDGEALTKYLSGKFTTSIIYLPTGERFSLNDVGNTTKNGQKIVSPENDNTSFDFFDPNTGMGQKFFYLWEAEGNVTNIIEGVTYVYGFCKWRHVDEYGFPIQYFYDEEAP